MNLYIKNSRASLAATLLLALVVWIPLAGSPAPARAVDDCPRIEVTSPVDVVDSGVPVTFTASVSGGDPAVRYTFRWEVSAGTITSGQGTSEITVDSTGLGDQDVKAAVEVGGFPMTCTNSDSLAVAVRARIVCCHSLDQYGDIRFRDEQARLDNFAIALQSEPGTKGYIMAYAGRRTRPNEAQRKANRAKGYLVNRRGLEAWRIIVINGGHREQMTFELYIVPHGMVAPTPTPTVEPSEVQIIRGGGRRIRRRRGE